MVQAVTRRARSNRLERQWTSASADTGSGSRFLKRLPAQRRGGLSIDRILQACEELLAAEPFDQVSIEDIARRAGVPVGSIYFFFNSRLSIFFRLIEVALGQIAVVYEFSDSELRLPLATLLRRLDRQLAAIWVRHRHILDLFFSYRAHDSIRPLVYGLQSHVDQQMSVRLAQEFPALPERRRQALARLVNGSLMQGLDIAAALPSARARTFRAEWSAMLHRYIEDLSG